MPAMHPKSSLPARDSCDSGCTAGYWTGRAGYRLAVSSGMGYRRYRRGSSLLSTLLLIWLIIGAIAAGQRDYYSSAKANCASWGTIAVTILAGPLNYAGVNPKVDCTVPQPSK
jgi:hypothetical protein